MIKKPLKSFTFPLLLVFYEIANYLSNDMYLPALPNMMHDLHLSTQQVQLTLMIWFAGMACTPMFFGAISDRYGRKPILLIGGIIFALASVACALAPNVTFLLVARFIQGAVIPSMMVAGYASIHELYDHKEAIKILALMSSITILAPALGPLFGGYVLYIAGWREIFWLIAIWTAIVIALLTVKMPETLAVENRQALHLKTLLKSYWQVITNKFFMLQMSIFGLLYGGFIIWISSGSLLVMERFHYTAVQYGLFQAFIFLFFIVGNRLVDPLVDRLGVEKLTRLGLWISLSGGILLTAAAIILPNSLYAYIVTFTLFSFGSSLCFSPINRMVVESSQEPMGVRVAVFTVFLMLFLAFASFLTAYVYNGTIMSMAVMTTIAVVLACLLKLFCLKEIC